FVIAEPTFFADVLTEHRAAFTTLLRYKAIVVPGQLQLSSPESDAAAEVPGIAGCLVGTMRDVVGPEVITEPLRQIAVPRLLHVRLLVNRRQKLTALRYGGFDTTLVGHILGSADRLPLFADFLVGHSFAHGWLLAMDLPTIVIRRVLRAAMCFCPFWTQRRGRRQIPSSKPWDLSNSCPSNYLIWDFAAALPRAMK